MLLSQNLTEIPFQGIPIVALAAGGVPANLEKSFEYLDGTPASGLVFAGVAGLSNAYPRLCVTKQRSKHF